MWDSETGEEIRRLGRPRGVVNSVRFVGDGRHVVAFGHNDASLLDRNDSAVASLITHEADGSSSQLIDRVHTDANDLDGADDDDLDLLLGDELELQVDAATGDLKGLL